MAKKFGDFSTILFHISPRADSLAFRDRICGMTISFYSVNFSRFIRRILPSRELTGNVVPVPENESLFLTVEYTTGSIKSTVFDVCFSTNPGQKWGNVTIYVRRFVTPPQLMSTRRLLVGEKKIKKINKMFTRQSGKTQNLSSQKK